MYFLTNLDPVSIFITGAAAFVGLVSLFCGKPKRRPLAEDYYSTVTVAEFHARQQEQKWWRP